MPQVPWANREELQWLCSLKCTICPTGNVQIHHLDGDDDNNDPENWTILCINCHDRAQRDLKVEGPTMSAKLTPELLRKFRRYAIEATLVGRLGSLPTKFENEDIPTTVRSYVRQKDLRLIENVTIWLKAR